VCARGDGIRRSKDLRAEIGKAPNSTNERKQMSTKTMKQRIALVAVSALTAGVLSVASAPVANAALVGTSVDGKIIATTGSSVCSATNDAGTALAAGDTRVSSADGFNIVMPIGARLVILLDANDNVEITGPLVASELDLDGAGQAVVQSINTKGRVLIDDPGATSENFILTATAIGTGTLVVSADGASTTPTDATTNSLDITVVASCASDVYVASKSFVYVKGADATVAVVASSNVDVATSASAGDSLFINITGKNTYGTALSTGSYAVSATNGALVSIGQAETAAPSKGTVSVVTGTPDGIDIVRIDPASQLVTSTTVVTITHNGTPVTTKSLTFFGEATSIEVLKTSIGRTSTTGAGTSTGFFVYQYKDSGANVVPGAAVSLDATTQTATVPGFGTGQAPRSSSGTVTSDLVDAIDTAIGSTASGVGVFTCGSTAATSTVTIKHTNAISGASITKSVALTCAGGIDTYVVSTDKASYAVGEIATITITAKDSKGNPVADSSTMGADGLVSVGGGALTKASVTADTFTSGVRTYKAQMTTAGTFNTVVSVSGTVTKSAETSYKVTDGGVSNAQVLQSIVALIASINKQIQALQALILKKK